LFRIFSGKIPDTARRDGHDISTLYRQLREHRVPALPSLEWPEFSCYKLRDRQHNVQIDITISGIREENRLRLEGLNGIRLTSALAARRGA
jgi:hypothetical protein